MGSFHLVGNFVNKTVVIPDDSVGGLANPIAVLGLAVIGIAIPSDWTPANVTFRGSVDGGKTYQDVFDTDGNEIVWIVSAPGRIFMDSPLTPVVGGYTHLKVRSGTASSPVDQIDSDYYDPYYGLQVEKTLRLICAPFET